MKKSYRLLLVYLLPVFILASGSPKDVGSYGETQKDFQYLSLFSEVISLIKNNYVEAIDPQSKLPSAFSSMLTSLDKRSSYLDPEETKQYLLYAANDHYGIGVFGIKLLNYFFITDVIPKSPADIAGLSTGDIIKGVNNNSLFSKSYWEMFLTLITKNRTNLNLTVHQAKEKKPKDITIQTNKISNPTTIKSINSKITLIQITQINNDSVKKLHEYFLTQKPVKLIIDLRRYSGGDFDSFLEISKLFFGPSTLLSLKSRNGEKPIPIGSPHALKYKSVVIINYSTIMFNELLAAMFKLQKSPDRHATLIGIPTTGFLSKLKHIPLDDNSSVLISDGFYWVKEKNVAETGISPDKKIKLEDFVNIMDKSIGILNQS